MLPRTIDIYRVLPEMVWCGFGVLVMLMQPFVRSRHFFTFLALIGTLAGTAASVTAAMHAGPGFGGLVQSDSFSFFFRLLVGTVAFLVALAAGPYLERERLPFAEFYSLLLFATAGMGVLASAQELLTAFIGLEMSSISSYILAGYRRDSLKSTESAMKYFLLGSFATAFFLYGIALVYGSSGTTMLTKMGSEELLHSTLFELGLAMILIGLGFKVAAAPFQVWTPDVYEGAPTPVTALFSAGPKAAAFALLLRIFATVTAAQDFWFWALWIAAALTMFAGNLGALVQTNLKRMLAYSSIAHAGYILVALTAAAATDHPEAGIAAALFYLVSYALVKLGAFLIVAHLGGTGERHVEIEDFTGLANRQPAMAECLSLLLLSLLGLPVTAGFLAKFYVFNAALESNLIWLAILLALNSVIGAYYCLRVMVTMYMREPKQEIAAEPVPWPLSIVLWIAAAGTVYVGLLPTRVIGFAAKAALNMR